MLSIITRHSDKSLHEVLQVLVQKGQFSVLLLSQRKKRVFVGAQLAHVSFPLALAQHPRATRRASLVARNDEMETEEELSALEDPLFQDLRVV